MSIYGGVKGGEGKRVRPIVYCLSSNDCRPLTLVFFLRKDYVKSDQAIQS